MIIWSGFGFLAGVVPVLCYMAIVKLIQIQYGPAYTASHSWPGALGTLLGAFAVWIIAEKLEAPTRVLTDEATGERVIFRKRHSLFFVPMRWWTAILIAVALWMLVAKHDSPL
jgi:hypothetical protein